MIQTQTSFLQKSDELRVLFGKGGTGDVHFSWHRVTLFGDVREPLTDFGQALGLKVIEEA